MHPLGLALEPHVHLVDGALEALLGVQLLAPLGDAFDLVLVELDVPEQAVALLAERVDRLVEHVHGAREGGAQTVLVRGAAAGVLDLFVARLHQPPDVVELAEVVVQTALEPRSGVRQGVKRHLGLGASGGGGDGRVALLAVGAGHFLQRRNHALQTVQARQGVVALAFPVAGANLVFSLSGRHDEVEVGRGGFWSRRSRLVALPMRHALRTNVLLNFLLRIVCFLQRSKWYGAEEICAKR